MGRAEVSELWPQEFRTTAETVFGNALNHTSFAMVNRRVIHAFDVWRRRYEMTPKQEEYAWDVLVWAVRTAGTDANRRINAGLIHHPYVYLRTSVAHAMERVVNAELTHEGFKRRAGLVDVTEQLEGAFA